MAPTQRSVLPGLPGAVAKAMVAAMLAAMLAGCSSSAPPRRPAVVERAATMESEALRAMRDGNLVLARNLFQRALLVQQSLDDLPGIATTSINLAAVYHRQKNDGMALRLLDAIANDKLVPYPVEFRRAAAFRKAVILVGGGEAGAAAAVQAAAESCGNSCEFTAGISNLRARMALQQRRYAEALQFAQAAEDAAGKGSQEHANALRNAAAAEAGGGRHDLALSRYQSALALDKELAVPRHIAEDLEGVAHELKQLGRDEEAASYARRAAAARDALGPVR